MNRIVQRHPVKINDHERVHFGNTITDIVQRLDKNAADAKAVAATYRQNTLALNAELRDCTNVLSSGVEYREVECSERPDFARTIVEIVRNDTGQVVDARPMKSSEYQQELPLTESDAAPLPNEPIVLSEILLDILAGKQWNADNCTCSPVDLSEPEFAGRICVTRASTADGKPVAICAYRIASDAPTSSEDAALGHYHSVEVKVREPHKKAVTAYLHGPELLFVPATITTDDDLGSDTEQGD